MERINLNFRCTVKSISLIRTRTQGAKRSVRIREVSPTYRKYSTLDPTSVRNQKRLRFLRICTNLVSVVFCLFWRGSVLWWFYLEEMYENFVGIQEVYAWRASTALSLENETSMLR